MQEWRTEINWKKSCKLNQLTLINAFVHVNCVRKMKNKIYFWRFLTLLTASEYMHTIWWVSVISHISIRQRFFFKFQLSAIFSEKTIIQINQQQYNHESIKRELRKKQFFVFFNFHFFTFGFSWHNYISNSIRIKVLWKNCDLKPMKIVFFLKINKMLILGSIVEVKFLTLQSKFL